ncbi:MAG: hypothetical protein ACK5C0_11420 [Candidatus Kapaibacterium sp.]
MTVPTVAPMTVPSPATANPMIHPKYAPDAAPPAPSATTSTFFAP